MEVDAAFGRVGFAESLLEARLFRQWIGFVVSKERLTEGEEGPLKYLARRVRAALKPRMQDVEALFSLSELEWFEREAVDVEAVLRPLTKADFGVSELGTVTLAGITSNQDPILRFPAERLSSARWDPDLGTVSVAVIEVDARGVSELAIGMSPGDVVEATGEPALGAWFDALSWSGIVPDVGLLDTPAARLAALEVGAAEQQERPWRG